MRDALLSPADFAMGARLIGGLPRVLRHPIRIEGARATLQQRLERREGDFLDLIRWGVTTLRASAPLVLINVSLGDQAVMKERRCGCPLEALGWTTHLRDIRSHEKLMAGGMTFLDIDLIRVLEEVLPARFGGAPTDYQLVEEEAEGGQPRLRLLVHPLVGAVDVEALVETFLSAIGGGTGSERAMALLWRESKFLRVERQPPLAGPSGKIQHLHARELPPRP